MYECLIVNDTATTETSSYAHTLSLHNARPICEAGAECPVLAARITRQSAQQIGGVQFGAALVVTLGSAPGETPVGSEEHTSELQSLMRISYAVFCFKKSINHIIHHRLIV